MDTDTTTIIIPPKADANDPRVNLEKFMETVPDSLSGHTLVFRGEGWQSKTPVAYATFEIESETWCFDPNPEMADGGGDADGYFYFEVTSIKADIEVIWEDKKNSSLGNLWNMFCEWAGENDIGTREVDYRSWWECFQAGGKCGKGIAEYELVSKFGRLG